VNCAVCMRLDLELLAATRDYVLLIEKQEGGATGLEEALAEARRARDEIASRIKEHNTREHSGPQS
jgi:hypothetical protein